MSIKEGPPEVSSVLVTGASGELGKALVRRLARPGMRFTLWGRDLERLNQSAQDCYATGATATVRSQDLTDIGAAIAALRADDDAARFDMALFASGLGDIRPPGALVEDPAMIARLGQVNFLAPAALASDLAGRMAGRGTRGRIVLVGSSAAFHALPFATAYCSSKAGLARFADALRIAMRRQGVSVTLASPGFIDTASGRATAEARPMAISPEEAAARIVRAAMARKAHLVTPWPFAALRLFDRALPRVLRDRLLESLTPP